MTDSAPDIDSMTFEELYEYAKANPAPEGELCMTNGELRIPMNVWNAMSRVTWKRMSNFFQENKDNVETFAK